MAIPIDILNSRLLSSLDVNLPAGLAFGRIGIVVYLYELSRYSDDNELKEKADSLLSEMIENGLSLDNGLGFEDGLCGTGMAMDYIVSRGFVSGNLDYILSDIDSAIFRHISFPDRGKTDSMKDLSQYLIYTCRRLRSQKSLENVSLYRELAMELVNRMADSISPELFNEPFSYSPFEYIVPCVTKAISIFTSLVEYEPRMTKILEKLSHHLFCHFPSLHSHRLALLWGILPLTSVSDTWNSYANRLKSNIDFKTITEKELKNRNIFISNGLASIYVLYDSIKTSFPSFAPTFDVDCIYDRIMSSDAWDTLLGTEHYYRIHKGLATGFPGVILTLYDLKSKYL